MLRRKLGVAIEALQRGERPAQPADLGTPIPTYAGDTVVHMPAIENGDDDALILETSRRIAAAYEEGDSLTGEARDEHIQQLLAKL